MKSETMVEVLNYIDVEIDIVKDKKSDYIYEEYIAIIHAMHTTKAVLIDCKNRLSLREEKEREIHFQRIAWLQWLNINKKKLKR